MKTLDREAVKAIRLQTVAFDAKYNRKSAWYRRHAARFGHTCLGTLLGTVGGFFAGSVQKTEGKTRRGDGFFDRRPFNESSGPMPRAPLIALSTIDQK
jgi:hypothetical protein